ncbi:sensor histidine kinase [Nocardia brevicatena]|uniref:sensor histidine kinase n=1 Tax=Nocardia brevicatena TaxID=37327 RepID=UPI00031F743B|nr:histidine kinase [Nocardia brevicatena]
MNSVASALRAGPRYLVSSWPWRTVIYVALGGVLALVTLIGIVPLLALGLTRRLRAALWEPVLRAHCARLRLIDPVLAIRADARVRAAADNERLPSVRQLAYAVGAAVSGGAAFVLAALASAIVAILLVAPRLVRDDHFDLGPWTVDTASRAWPVAAIGFLAGVVLLVLLGCWAALEGAAARALLISDSDRWRHEAERIESSRSGLLEAEGFERELLESELHDRVQHRLVALSMSLGLTEAKDENGPAGRLAADAHRQVDETLAELRAVLRGFSPRALVERGLEPALVDLAADMPLDVTFDLEGGPDTHNRLPSAVEHMSYVLVAEALTNVARHTDAHRVVVHGARAGSTWTLRITDDGPGGAHIPPGHGIDRLTRRVAALDGTLTMTSPPGGPTTLRMECPV